MKFFVDSADIGEIRDLVATGLVDGVTTNPSLVAKTGRNFLDLIAEICALDAGPVSAEVSAVEFDVMLAEAERLAEIAESVVVKVPLTPAGLKVCHTMSRRGTLVNVTLCFSAAQALLAAKAGAMFVSPFVGRLDDIGHEGLALVSDICGIYERCPLFQTKVLVASVRSPSHVVEAARRGAFVATMPPETFRQLFKHPLTDIGLQRFIEDWQKTGQSILKGDEQVATDCEPPKRASGG